MIEFPHLFTVDAEGRYLPSTHALGRWAPDMLAGPAVCSAAARDLQLRFGDDAFVPARFTIELFKAARNEPLAIRTREVRSGRRIRVTAAEVCQGETVVAAATMVQLRRSGPPPGLEWRSEHPFDPPTGGDERRWYGSDAVGWTQTMGDHQNSSRKRLWIRPVEVVRGSQTSPFEAAVMAAEGTSLVTNWGSDGIGYINSDVTVALSRLPSGDRIGLEAQSHITADGIAVGTATLFDHNGAIGTGMVTALSNPAAQIDFSND